MKAKLAQLPLFLVAPLSRLSPRPPPVRAQSQACGARLQSLCAAHTCSEEMSKESSEAGQARAQTLSLARAQALLLPAATLLSCKQAASLTAGTSLACCPSRVQRSLQASVVAAIIKPLCVKLPNEAPELEAMTPHLMCPEQPWAGSRTASAAQSARRLSLFDGQQARESNQNGAQPSHTLKAGHAKSRKGAEEQRPALAGPPSPPP